MDPRDIALQFVAPTIMVPRFGEFEPLATNGHRFLAAKDGLWLEVKRPWLYARKPLATQSAVAMPYGEVTATINILCPRVPKALIQEFEAKAKAQSPNECAAWITWNEHRNELRLRSLEEISAGKAHVKVIRPVLDDGEHLVLDLHSHGRFPAGFSKTDDRDDAGEVKVSLVVGNCDQEETTIASRLCLMGLYEPLAM